MNGSSAQEFLQARLAEAAAYSSGNAAELVPALLKAAENTPDPAEKLGLLYRAGSAAERAGDQGRALELFGQVKGHPIWGPLALLGRLEINWQKGEWPSLLAVLDEQLGEVSLWKEGDLRLEKARVLAFRLGRVEEAQVELDKTLALDPACREAIWLKLTLALRSGDWEAVLSQYQKLRELSAADQDAAFLQSASLRLAQIHEFRRRELGEAKAWYEQLDAGMNSFLPRTALLELAEANQDFPAVAAELSALLTALAGAGDPGPALSLKLTQCRLLEDVLSDPESADRELEALVKQFPDHFSALYPAAERAQETGPADRRADLDARAAKLIADPKAAAVFQGDRVRALLDDLDQPAAAVAAAQTWLAAAPGDKAAERWAIEAMIRAGQFGEAVAAIDRALENMSDLRERQGLLFQKAELATHKLGDPKLALGALLAALEIPPSQFPILKTMARLYHLNRDYENLTPILTAAMKLVQDPGLKKYYQTWLGFLNLERLGREDQAFALFGELVKSDPQDRLALHVIARLSKKKASWPNLIGALTRLADNTSDRALQAELKTRVAWLLETRLNQPEKALAIYQEVNEHPLAQESLRRLYYRKSDLSAYAAVLQAGAEPGPQSPFRAARLCRLAAVREIQGELAEAWAAYEKARVSLIQQPFLYLPMIDLAQLAGYWGRYLSLLEEFAARVLDANKKTLFWEAAWSRSEIPGPNGVVDAEAMFTAMQNLDQTTGGWSAALRGSFLACLWTGDHRARADILARMIKQVPEDAAAPLRLRLAATLRDDLGAVEESIAAFRQVLVKDPQSLALIRELELMYESAGQWGELIRMKLMEIPLRKEPLILIAIYARLAELYEEKFQAADEAIKCHVAVLHLDPRQLSSHRERVRLLEARSRWDDLDKALAEYEAVVAEPAEKVSIMVQAAKVCDEKLGSPDRAIGHLQKALTLLPARRDVLDALVVIFEREKRWSELCRILADQAARTPSPADQAALYENIAVIHETKIGDPAAAIQNLVTARDLVPERPSVLLSLERLFAAAGRFEELIDTLERLARPADNAAKIGYFSRIGALWDENLARLPEAVASWERVRPLDPANEPALAALVSLYERTRDFPALVERSVALAEVVAADKARAVDLLCRAGQVLETNLNDDDRALELYHRAMQIDPAALAPIPPARAIYVQRSAWPEVVKLWSAEEGLSDAVVKKLEIFTEIGKIYEHQIKDAATASGAYEKALALAGDYLPAVIPLSEIYFRQGAFDRARPLFEVRTRELSREMPAMQAEVWDKAGWCAEQMGDVPAAMSRYRSSAEAVAEYRHPLERLSELYAQQEKWEDAAGFTDRLLAVVKTAGDLGAAFVFLSRKGLIEDKRNRLPDSALAYEEALQLQPGNYEIISRLVDLYTRQREWKKALAAYDLQIKNSPNPEAAANGLVGKGGVLEDQLREEESALAHFKKAVEIAPAHLLAWTRLSAIYFRRSSWPEAELALQNLLKLEPEKPKKVAHHFHLGQVYDQGLADLARGREQYEAALALDQLHVPSMQALGEIYLKQEEWEKFIGTSEKFARLIPPEGQASLLPIYLQMGRVYRDHLKNTERAVLNFQQVIKFNPEDKEARSELAGVYLSDAKFIDQAKSENRNLLRLSPDRVQTYRDLADIYKSQKNLDAQFLIYSILYPFDILDTEEQIFYEANLGRVPKTGRRMLKDVEREGHLIHPEERGPLRDMLLALGDTLDKVFPAPLDKYGAKKSAKLPDDSPAPINALALEVQQVLGLESFSIYVSPAAAEPQVMPTIPPALVVNADYFGRFNEREQRFLMARAVERMINRHGFLAHYPPEPVFRTLCLLAMAADPGVNFTLPGVSPDEAEKQKKNLRKLISRKYKVNLERAAQRFTADLANLDPAVWKKAMDHTANRAGLLVCADWNAAVSAMLKTDPRFANQKSWDPKDLIPIWQQHPDVVELLTFAVSDSFYRLRHQVGLAIA